MSVMLLRKIVLPGMNLIEENIELLTELDSVIGDGDHGVTMGKIVKLVRCRLLELDENVDVGDALEELSWDVMNISGGSAGPLWGAFFEGMGEGAALDGNDEKEIVINMLKRGYENFADISKAVYGQKTMMDAIYPATMVLENEGDLPYLTSLMAEEAIKGADATAEMIAQFGRAKSIGEKSIGHRDPGAVSFSLFYRGIAQGFNK